MLSSRCRERNEVIIPRLLGEHATQPDLIDLRTADNWFMKRAISQALPSSGQNIVSEDDLGYSQDIGGPGPVRSALSLLLRNHVWPDASIPPSSIILGAGGSYVLDALIEATCDPGDLIMIATPYWSGLDLCISIHNSAAVFPVSIPLSIFFTPASVSFYEHALRNAKAPVKAVLICNPHNPLGGCYPLETLDAMASFCGKHNLHLISDEVYALSVHGGTSGANQSFISALHLSRFPFVHVIYSLSKDFGCNGIRLGALVSSNQPVCMSVALSTHSQLSSITARYAINTVLQPHIIELALTKNREYLRRNYSAVSHLLKRRGIEFYPASAGFFVFAKLCDIDEKGFDGFLKECDVALAMGTSYHFNEPGWFRICFALSPSVLRRALDRIGWALDLRERKSLRRSKRSINTSFNLKQNLTA